VCWPDRSVWPISRSAPAPCRCAGRGHEQRPGEKLPGRPP
jgi:hypothetical protein